MVPRLASRLAVPYSRGPFSIRDGYIEGYRTERGLFPVRDDSGDADYDKKLPEAAGPQAEKKGTDRNYLVTTTMTATSFFPESFKAPLDPGL